MAITIDQCLVQPSSEKFPAAADGNKYGDPQPDIVQPVGDLGILSPKWDVSIKSLPLGLRKPCGNKTKQNKKQGPQINMFKAHVM